MIYLETDRLQLRGWRDEDFAPFAVMNADKVVMEFYPATKTRARSDEFAKQLQQNLRENGFGLYAIEVKSANEFIGYVGLAKAEFPAAFTPAMEIGWRLASQAWGRGYATEAARACLAYGFAELDLDEIVSFTAQTNRRSIAVMERIGMSRTPDDDFDHPMLPIGHALRPHVLYRIGNPGATSTRSRMPAASGARAGRGRFSV